MAEKVRSFVIRQIARDIYDDKLELYINNMIKNDPELSGATILNFQYIIKGLPYQYEEDILKNPFYSLIIFYIEK